jgi:chromosomal replication initiation ATPase DnaA
MTQQLGFDLPSRPALGRDAFFVSPANAVALALIDSWPNWAGNKLVLTGPKGAGKTHLTHVWAAASGARIIKASSLASSSASSTPADQIPDLATGPVAVEDIDQIAGNPEAETGLFHLHNLVLAEGHSILFTGNATIVQWGLQLPDLLSRLQGATVAALEAPDDALLTALLVKLLADRQLTPKAELIPYLLGRMDRSFAAAIDLVERLDSASLAQKRPITRQLAAGVLDKDAPDT